MHHRVCTMCRDTDNESFHVYICLISIMVSIIAAACCVALCIKCSDFRYSVYDRIFKFDELSDDEQLCESIRSIELNGSMLECSSCFHESVDSL